MVLASPDGKVRFTGKYAALFTQNWYVNPVIQTLLRRKVKVSPDVEMAEGLRSALSDACDEFITFDELFDCLLGRTKEHFVRGGIVVTISDNEFIVESAEGTSMEHRMRLNFKHDRYDGTIT